LAAERKRAHGETCPSHSGAGRRDPDRAVV
jgi:hypothetical protein